MPCKGENCHGAGGGGARLASFPSPLGSWALGGSPGIPSCWVPAAQGRPCHLLKRLMTRLRLKKA